MSLTEFIGQSSVKTHISDEFPNQGTRAERPLEAEWQTQNYMLIGTAFDYLLRFWLQRNVPNYHARQWVAETSLDQAEILFPAFVPDVREAIERAEDALDAYLTTGQLTRPLIESAIDLARIDGIYRGGKPPVNLGEYDDDDIVDCIKLMELLDRSEALDGTQVHLNPTFGLASTLVGGADADAILDGVLIDVKTTGKATFKVDYWRQLIGYLVLADVHRTLHDIGLYDHLDDKRELPEIEAFGVYFSRHGELSTVPASVVYEAENYAEFRSWFVATALEQYDPFDESLTNAFRMLF